MIHKSPSLGLLSFTQQTLLSTYYMPDASAKRADPGKAAVGEMTFLNGEDRQ